MHYYSSSLESEMVCYYESLGERGKREYAALESKKLPYGGKGYICKLFKMSYFRLRKGLKELNDADFKSSLGVRERRLGGGRKKFCEPQRY